MVKKRLVLDTNIIVSSFGWEGNPRRIMEKIINGELNIIISDKQAEEIIRVLNYPKFKFTEDQKQKFLNILLDISVLIKTKKVLYVIKEDESDNRILESAVEGNADFIITGDEHLLKLKEFCKIKIFTAKEFLENWRF